VPTRFLQAPKGTITCVFECDLFLDTNVAALQHLYGRDFDTCSVPFGKELEGCRHKCLSTCREVQVQPSQEHENLTGILFSLYTIEAVKRSLFT